VRRFIYFSTAHIYGAPLVGAISEQTVPRPIHPYAITHKVAEDFVLAALDQGKIDGIVLRLSNGFGAPVAAEVNRWTLVVNDLCRQAVSTGKLVLRSNGLQQRDFITLQDTARCVAHFIALPKADCGDGLFNLGGECSRSIYAITQMVAARCQVVLGFTPAIERIEPQPGEQGLELEYSIAKLKASGFSLHNRYEDEIDATLVLCQKAFGKN
jgi:UDP-glucose 4-epimerase